MKLEKIIFLFSTGFLIYKGFIVNIIGKNVDNLSKNKYCYKIDGEYVKKNTMKFYNNYNRYYL